jgi:hypothetical protein
MSDPQISNHSVLAVVLHDETRIWNMDGQDTKEALVVTKAELENRHVRQAQHHGGHESTKSDPGYFKDIAEMLADAREVLLMGHGTGKSNTMVAFHEHVKSHNGQLAAKILAELNADLPALSDGQIRKLGHDWLEAHRRGAANH